MSETVIQVEGLSKQYRLGEVSTGSLHHDINRWWHKIRGKEDPYLSITGRNIRTGKREGGVKAETLKREKAKTGNENDTGQSKIPAFQHFNVSDFSSDYVWALKDINFEVKRGEVLGIIGRNGAGKSTLLKILSRITAPTTGEVRVKGRIGSLLEVGTGFHQDLTGRENIFLNGAVLGMNKTEIAAKLDEIVEFSGCAAYLDTPVKRYSSGMVVRLGFAVAAHLEPEILIVDEVLAVGDAEFQKKCIGKMQDVASHGRTVLFVSHNMTAVQRLCPKSLMLENGEIVCGPLHSGDVVHEYLAGMRSVITSDVNFRRDGFYLESVAVTNVDGQSVQYPVRHDEPHYLEVTFTLDRYDSSFCLGYELFSQEGEVLYMSMSSDAGPEQCPRIARGRNRLRSLIPAYMLNEGDYSIGVVAYFEGAVCLVNPHKDDVLVPFPVRMGPGVSPRWNNRRIGFFAPLMHWDCLPDDRRNQGTGKCSCKTL
jgi:lipopolysaccharide transport system ATP-binding protein